MASPHVAGSIALVMSAIKKDCDLEELMEDSAQKLEQGDLPERDVYGAGLIRVDKMAKAVVETSKTYRRSLLEEYGREVLSVLKEVL